MFGRRKVAMTVKNRNEFKMKEFENLTSYRSLILICFVFVFSMPSCAVFSQSAAKTSNRSPSSASSSSGGIAAADNGLERGESESAAKNSGDFSSVASGGESKKSLEKAAETASSDAFSSDDAQTLLDSAYLAFDSGNYKQALRFASEYAESGRLLDHDAAVSLALAAAVRLSPIEWNFIESESDTPRFERAILGQLHTAVCYEARDMACVASRSQLTSERWRALGEEERATEMAKIGENLHSEVPVVAVLLPLSGKDRRMGRAMLGAFLQASGIYDHRDLPFAIRFFDTQSSDASIPEIVSSLETSGIRLVLGPIDILESLKTAQLLSPQTTMVGFSPNDGFLGDRSHVFQYSYAIEREVQKLASIVVGLNPKRSVALAPQNAYSETMIEQLNASLPTSLTFESVLYPAAQTDLREIASRVATSVPDIVFLPSDADSAERMASFLAQENIWCATPDAPRPTLSSDTRRFVTCLGTSSWAPIRDDHHYRFIVNALYLDYTDISESYDSAFSTQFSALYHRLPSVNEILPYALISVLREMPESVWEGDGDVSASLRALFNGQKYLAEPGIRQVAANGSKAIAVSNASLSLPMRSLSVTVK